MSGSRCKPGQPTIEEFIKSGLKNKHAYAHTHGYLQEITDMDQVRSDGEEDEDENEDEDEKAMRVATMVRNLKQIMPCTMKVAQMERQNDFYCCLYHESLLLKL